MGRNAELQGASRESIGEAPWAWGQPVEVESRGWGREFGGNLLDVEAKRDGYRAAPDATLW